VACISFSKYEVDWHLIDKTINYMRNRIIELYLPTERHLVIEKFNLEEVCKKDKPKMIKKVWENKFIGNRHVMINFEPSLEIWNKPIDLNQGKPNERSQFILKI
jgi:hypothetical protein